MENFDASQWLSRAAEAGRALFAPDQIAVTVAAALLSLVFVLAVAAIWRGRRSTVTPLPTPSNASGFTRWLTPMGMQSIPAEQAVVARPRRKSGSYKAIRVSTPVSKVPARALRSAGADALEIARRSGLARDAVMMMMANANPQGAARKQTTAKVAAVAKAPTRTTATANTERAMTAPGAYANTPRAAQSAARNGTLGTQFNARIS